jgi:hypothetical protein
MRNLKTKSNIILISMMCFCGCTTMKNTNTPTSFFIVKAETSGLTELIVTPDRMVPQCTKLDVDPDEGQYGFMIHMLDEKNTVTSTMLNVRPDKESCEKHLRKIKHIIKNGTRIYSAHHMALTSQPRKEDRDFPHSFPGHGTFFDNGRALDFVLISNDKGECYNPHVGDGKPCLEYPFPIEKYRK